MGPIENNVYVIGDDEAAFVVDPTCEANRIYDTLRGRKCLAIVLTHAHWDHVGAACALRDLTGAPVVASALDALCINGTEMRDPNGRRFEYCPVDQQVNDNDVLQIGTMNWKVMLTPGHTPGSMCLFLDAQYGMVEDGAPVLVSGDTLFAGTHGRTDFVGGNPAAMSASLKRLAMLPDDTVVLPGHMEPSQIGFEKEHNPFVR